MFGWFRKKPPPANGPDFSGIDSQAMVEEAFRRGELEQLFLMPLEFGGEEIPPNTVYVPIGVAAIKAGIDHNVVGPLVEEGKVTSYTAAPQYQGSSFVPSAIRIVASNPGEFTTTINIWGEALATGILTKLPATAKISYDLT
jgi:hypothetical protein